MIQAVIMSHSQSTLSDRRYNDLEVYSHSNLEVASEPQSSIANNGCQPDSGPYPRQYEGDKHYGTSHLEGQYSLGNQSQQVEVQRKRIKVMIVISAVVSALVAGGVVGAGLGSSLAECRDNASYAYPSHIRLFLYF